MNKISGAQVGQMMKLAAENLRALSEENQGLKSENDSLKEKVASYEKRERAEKIAAEMSEKGLRPELSTQEKVASLLEQDLDVIEKAIEFQPARMKIASVYEDGQVPAGEGDEVSDQAALQFAANIASL